MIFTQADFDLLRLLRWNRHLLPETIDGLFTERDIQNLIALGPVSYTHLTLPTICSV